MNKHSIMEMSVTLCRMKQHKISGHDSIARFICPYVLADILTDIFNTSLRHTFIPESFKTAKTIPVPKKTSASTLKKYQLLALTSVIKKHFHWLVKGNIKANLLTSLDLHTAPTGLQGTP